MTLYVGTSGWAYKEWKPDFYPADLPQKQFLSHYSSQLSACEINATFYRMQRNETFQNWHDAVPERFRFAIKAHRRLTHSKSIAPEGMQKEFLGRFLRSLQPLEERLGALLFQFPPYRKRDDDAFGRLLDEIPVERCAFEFRNDTWTAPEVRESIVARDGTVCFADTTGAVPAELPPGSIAYVRLRHQQYTEEQCNGWRELLERESATRDVYAFTKHEGVAAGDPFAGVGLAGWLAQAERAGQQTTGLR